MLGILAQSPVALISPHAASILGVQNSTVRTLVGSPEIGVTSVPDDSDMTLTATCIRWRSAWHLACLLLTTTAQVER